jgi:hypothetical protein
MKIDLLTVLLSSGVLAAIVTSIINLISIKATNKRLLQIEELKNDNSINSFRYTKLFELNAELNSLPEIDYTILEKKNGKLVQSENKKTKVVGESTNRFSMFVKIYNKAKPLFDESIISELKDLISNEKAESNEIVKALYTGGNSDISKLMTIRTELEEKLQESIVIQLRALISA